MSDQLKFKFTSNAALVLILVQVLYWSQEANGQFMMSRFHLPRQLQEARPQRLLREVMDVVLPIYEHDRQRLKLVEIHKPDERLGKVKRASKGSNCNSGTSSRGGVGGSNAKTGSVECPDMDGSPIESAKPVPIDDIKRMILRIESMLDKLIKSGYID